MSEENRLPRHIAIIMDGNGRWAKEKGLLRTAGHKVGIQRVEEVISSAQELGIEVLTLFAFSTENWSRPRQEIAMLMRAFAVFLDRQSPKLRKKNIRLKVIGREAHFSPALIKKIRQVEKATAHNTAMTVIIAVNYGGRQEIVDAVRGIAGAVLRGQMQLDEIDEETVRSFLYFSQVPDPDLLIRTSGEKRISNFLLWQLSYAELHFIDIYWPDFRKEQLVAAIKEYQRRHRRFGGL